MISNDGVRVNGTLISNMTMFALRLYNRRIPPISGA